MYDRNEKPAERRPEEVTSVSNLSIRPDDLEDLELIAEEKDMSLQDVLNLAIAGFIVARERERYPELAVHLDRTFEKNRKFYELLAE